MQSEKSGFSLIAAVIAITWSIILTVNAYAAGRSYGKQSGIDIMQKEAVQRGYARYVADVVGKVSFEWIDSSNTNSTATVKGQP